MFTPKTYTELCNAMQMGVHVALNLDSRTCVTGVITGISREDGSGRCWNVYVQKPNKQNLTVFMRFE
jgi:hypothetical protein